MHARNGCSSHAGAGEEDGNPNHAAKPKKAKKTWDEYDNKIPQKDRLYDFQVYIAK